MKQTDLFKTLQQVAVQYPEDLAAAQVQDIRRIAFHIRIALDATHPKLPNELEVCDLGGGVGLFSVGCAACGFKRTMLIDDFNDPVNHRVGASVFELHRRLGVVVESRDVVHRGMQDIEGQFDVITTFDSMEHWHHSPKKLFHQVVEKLKPSGIFVLGVPNCVNLRKRITVPLGSGKWSQMHDWYETDVFRGHVREPDIGDLRYIARDMGLTQVRVFGRNWLGYNSRNAAVRRATAVVDVLLRIRPTLCSDIYMVGRIP